MAISASPQAMSARGHHQGADEDEARGGGGKGDELVCFVHRRDPQFRIHER
jgi:hypothetical protein